MPIIVSWWNLIGRHVDVTSGPLSGLEGTLQDTRTNYGIVGFVNQQTREFATFNALLSDMTPKLTNDEELQ